MHRFLLNQQAVCTSRTKLIIIMIVGRVGRFTITNLNESDKSDVSADTKISVNPDDSMEIKLKFEKSNVINQSKSVQKEQIVVPMKKNIGIQDTLSSNVRKI